MANGNNNNRRRRRRRNNNNNNGNGPSRTPVRTLNRTFRYRTQFTLNNTTGSGDNQYCYYSKYLKMNPDNAYGFREAQQTFELWRLRRFRVKALVGYNGYNSTYGTVNLDTIGGCVIWTAADLSPNETISGESLMSYQNARCNTLSFNNLTTIVNSQARLCTQQSPNTILPNSTWLDTSGDISSMSDNYSGFQIFATFPGISSTNWLPKVQLIIEMDCEFKQPGFQNRPSSFELDIIGAKLETIPDGTTPEVTREYAVTRVTLTDSGYEYHLDRTDGVAGSLTYDGTAMYNVFVERNSGTYFSGRAASWTGTTPRRPVGWTPTE